MSQIISILTFQAPQVWGAAEHSEVEGLFYRFKAQMRLIAKKDLRPKTLSENAWPSSNRAPPGGGREQVETIPGRSGRNQKA